MSVRKEPSDSFGEIMWATVIQGLRLPSLRISGAELLVQAHSYHNLCCHQVDSGNSRVFNIGGISVASKRHSGRAVVARKGENLEESQGISSRGISGFVYVTLAQLGSTVLGAIFWIGIASILHPRALGYLSWLISIGTLVSIACSLGLGKTVVAYYPKKEGKGGLLSGATLFVLVVSVGIGAIFSLLLDPVVGFLIIGFSSLSVATYSELAKQQYRNYMVLMVGARLLSISLAILFYFWFGVITGIIAGFAVAHFLFGLKALSNFHSSPSIIGLKETMGFSLHSWGADLSRGSINFIDKILIGQLFGMTTLGLYWLANRIFLLFGILPQILFFYLFPQKSAGKTTKWIAVLGTFFSAIFAAAIFFISPLVIQDFLPHFYPAIGAIRLMGLALIPATIAGIKLSELYSEGKSGVVIESHILALAVWAASFLILGESFGVLGLAGSMMLLQITLAISLFILPE